MWCFGQHSLLHSTTHRLWGGVENENTSRNSLLSTQNPSKTRLSNYLGQQWLNNGLGDYRIGLVIDREGRNFVGNFSHGIVLCEAINGKWSAKQLDFDDGVPPIQLEELMA